MRVRGWMLPAVVLLLLIPLLAGVLGGGAPGGGVVVVASAPRVANGMTIAVAVPRSVFSDGAGTAYSFISFDNEVIYPPGGVLGAPIVLTEGKGSIFVPYSNFVVENADYIVTVDYNDHRTSTQVPVTKWVNWVYLLPYVRNDTLVIDVVLERTQGLPSDRVFAAGLLNLEVRYRGQDGDVDELRLARNLITDGQSSFQRLVVPIRDVAQGDRNRGYYEVVATFHNHQANGNNDVPLDPTLANSSPPMNWVYLDVADPCQYPVDLTPFLPC